MTISARTIQRWKAELESNRRLQTLGSRRFRWLRSLYARVYQFLLNRYEDELPSSRDGAEYEYGAGDQGDAGSKMPFVDLTADHLGLQARSAQSVRKVLERVHFNQPARSLPGKTDREWVVVATSQDWVLSACEQILADQNIEFRKRRIGFYKSLEVRFKDRDAAFAMLRSPRRYRKKTRLFNVYYNPVLPVVFITWMLFAGYACYLLFSIMRNITASN